MAFFDGAKFSAAPVLVQGLPKGNTCIWTEKGVIKCLVQTRSKRTDPKGSNGRMEIWNISPEAAKPIWPKRSLRPQRAGTFPAYRAEHFVWENREYILRSTWQNFELWRAQRRGHLGTSAAERRHAAGRAGCRLFFAGAQIVFALAVCAAFVMMARGSAWCPPRGIDAAAQASAAGRVRAALRARRGVFGGHLHRSGDVAGHHAFLLPTNCLRRIFPALDIPPLPALACFMIYFTGFEWYFSATPGKFLMGLRVVMDGGKPLTLWPRWCATPWRAGRHLSC